MMREEEEEEEMHEEEEGELELTRWSRVGRPRPTAWPPCRRSWLFHFPQQIHFFILYMRLLAIVHDTVPLVYKVAKLQSVFKINSA